MEASDLEIAQQDSTRHTMILNHNNVYNYRNRDPRRALYVESPHRQAALANPPAGPYCPLSNIGSFPILLEASRVVGNVRTMISSISL